MRTCKLHLSKRIWARRVVRWLGFDLVPDYTIEDIEVCIKPIYPEGNTEENYIVLTSVAEHFFEYYDVGSKSFKYVSRDFLNSCNVTLVRFHYNKKFVGCPIVDSENDWEKRLQESKEKVGKKVGKQWLKK